MAKRVILTSVLACALTVCALYGGAYYDVGSRVYICKDSITYSSCGGVFSVDKAYAETMNQGLDSLYDDYNVDGSGTYLYFFNLYYDELFDSSTTDGRFSTWEYESTNADFMSQFYDVTAMVQTDFIVGTYRLLYRFYDSTETILNSIEISASGIYDKIDDTFTVVSGISTTVTNKLTSIASYLSSINSNTSYISSISSTATNINTTLSSLYTLFAGLPREVSACLDELQAITSYSSYNRYGTARYMYELLQAVQSLSIPTPTNYSSQLNTIIGLMTFDVATEVIGSGDLSDLQDAMETIQSTLWEKYPFGVVNELEEIVTDFAFGYGYSFQPVFKIKVPNVAYSDWVNNQSHWVNMRIDLSEFETIKDVTDILIIIMWIMALFVSSRRFIIGGGD